MEDEKERIFMVISEELDTGHLLFRLTDKFLTTPETLTALVLGVYTSIIDRIPEEHQVEVEETFINQFLDNFDNRYDFINVREEKDE